MQTFPSIATKNFTAWIADNTEIGSHKRGLNGIAKLIHHNAQSSLFVPEYSGLNFESIYLGDFPPSKWDTDFIYEPRTEKMYYESISEKEVVLLQPETNHSHISARITFKCQDPYYLHQRIELTFHRREVEEGSKVSRSLWASYMNSPDDRHVYLSLDESQDTATENWYGVTKDNHAAPRMKVRPLQSNRKLSSLEHSQCMQSERPLEDGFSKLPKYLYDAAPMALPTQLDQPLRFFYGFMRDSLMFLVMFKQPELFRLAYSPCGGGKHPAWNPAWDYQLLINDYQYETPYTADLCLAIKPYDSRDDILNEVVNYQHV